MVLTPRSTTNKPRESLLLSKLRQGLLVRKPKPPRNIAQFFIWLSVADLKWCNIHKPMVFFITVSVDNGPVDKDTTFISLSTFYATVTRFLSTIWPLEEKSALQDCGSRILSDAVIFFIHVMLIRLCACRTWWDLGVEFSAFLRFWIWRLRDH